MKLYENVPVFRTGTYNDIEDLLGKATVEVDEESHRTKITMEVGEGFTAWMDLGELRGLYLSGVISNVDREKAIAFWSKQP